VPTLYQPSYTNPLAVIQQQLLNTPFARVVGASPYRMIFINPRKYFNPTDTVDFSKMLRKVFREAITEWMENALANISPVSATLATAISQYATDLIKGADGSFYMFFINPTTLRVNHSKITQEVLTGAGWDFDILGDQLSTFTFSGTSGNMLQESLELFSIKLSRAYFKFLALEQFYLYNNNDPLLMILDQTAYLVKFISLTWNWDANDIYQIKYDFTVKTNPLTAFDIISGAGITTLFNTVKLGDVLFDPSKREDLFVISSSGIDVYEKEMKLYE